MKSLLAAAPVLIASGVGMVHAGVTVEGTLSPIGDPLGAPTRVEAGPACVVDLTQRYAVGGGLSGRMEIDYRILVHGPCGSRAGTFDEEWIAHGVFDGTLEGDSASGTFVYTAKVRNGGRVSGTLTFGSGLDGALTIRGRFSDGSLSYSGAVDRESGVRALRVRERVDVRGIQPVREPMLVAHPGGALFVAGYSRALEETDDPPNLYRSDDGGRTWSQVDVGAHEDGAMGNSDVDLAVGPDGTLYFVSMRFDRSVGEGTDIVVGVSRDVGATWRWQSLAHRRFVDRPWIAVSSTGRIHAVWNDDAGVSHSFSDDEGRTWHEAPRISARGGSSHLAAGPGGRVAARIGPIAASGNDFDEGVDSIAVSSDDGDTWQMRAVPGDRQWSESATPSRALPRWVEPIGWGMDGEIYYLWSEGKKLWLGRSDDLAATWHVSPLVSDESPLYYPFMSVGSDGRIAASWFSGFGPQLRAHVGLISRSEQGPVLEVTPPLDVDAWRMQDGQRVRDTAGEYVPVAFLSDGSLGAVLPIQESEGGSGGFAWLRISR